MIDLDIRAIKIQLGMDVLRCQSPEMVRTEIWTCLLAYNLIRKTILESAKRSDLSPRQIRFTAAMQKLAASWESVLLLSEASLALLVPIIALLPEPRHPAYAARSPCLSTGSAIRSRHLFRSGQSGVGACLNAALRPA